MRLILMFTLVTQFSSILLAQSQSADNRTTGSVISGDVVDVWRDAGDIFFSPLHFDDKAWLTSGAVIGGTLLLLPLDTPVREAAMRNQSPTADNVSEVGRQCGREIYGLALSGGFYIGGLTFGNS